MAGQPAGRQSPSDPGNAAGYARRRPAQTLLDGIVEQ